MHRFFQRELIDVQKSLRFQTFTPEMLKAYNYKPSGVLQAQLLALYKAGVLRTTAETELLKLLQSEEIVALIPRKDEVVLLRFSSDHTLALQLVEEDQGQTPITHRLRSQDRLQSSHTKTGVPLRFHIDANVFDPSPCKLDVLTMQTKIRKTGLPSKVKTILMNRLQQPSIDPSRVCRDFTKNIETLLGLQFAKDGWTVVQFLGAGAFGITVAIHRIVNDKPDLRALKIVAEESFATFRKELNMHEKMAHLGLAPKVYSDMLYEGRQYGKRVIMAYGMEQIDMLARDFLNAPQMREQMHMFGKQIVDILKRMKQNNLTHGDLHTENLALHQGRLQLIDFGWSIDTRAWPLYDYVQLFRSMMMDFLEDIEECMQTTMKDTVTKWLWVCANHYKMVNRMKLLFTNLANEFGQKEDRHFFDAFGPIFDDLGNMTKTLKRNVKDSIWQVGQRNKAMYKLHQAVQSAFGLLDAYQEVLFDEYENLI